MQNTIEILHLSKKEKLRALEAIWEDLPKDKEQIESPNWHQKVLQETKNRLTSGEEKVLDWETAKKDLRKRFK